MLSISRLGDDALMLSNDTLMMQPSKASLSPQIYEIRVHEDLDDDLVEWFNPLRVEHTPSGATTLTVPVRDQAELHGLLIKIRDLNLTLIAIKVSAL